MSRTNHIRGIGPLGALLAGLLLVLAAAGPAAAETAPLVPPGNSAVNQYTEAFPTAGGDRDANNRKGRKPTAKDVIGERNANKLRQQGPEGEAVADLTAETAPEPATRQASEEGEDGDEESGAGAAPGTGGGGGGDSNAVAGGGTGAPTQDASRSPAVVVPEAEGSSGLGEVIARATGISSGGGLGIFLPLLILATMIWAFAYLAGQRRPVG